MNEIHAHIILLYKWGRSSEKGPRAYYKIFPGRRIKVDACN